MRDMIGRSLLKFFRSPAINTTQPSSSNEYQQLNDDRNDYGDQDSIRTLFTIKHTDPIDIPASRKESKSNHYAHGEGSYSHSYTLVDIGERLSKSVNIGKCLLGSNMDGLDRVPVDFSTPSGPTIMTDRNEVGEILLHGESRACYGNQSSTYDLISSSMHHAERWFHSNIDHQKAELMLLKTGGKDGSFLVRVNERNCLVLTICYHQKIYNIFISCKANGRKTTFFIETPHQFSTLIDLVKYYTKHQGLFLPCKLSRGVALRWPGPKKSLDSNSFCTYGIANQSCTEEEY